MVTGTVRVSKDPKEEKINSMCPYEDDEELIYADDVYKELWLHGYEYGEHFRGILKAKTNGSRGVVGWKDNWIVFMDNMLQLSILEYKTRELLLPTSIKKIVIDPELHLKFLKENSKSSVNFLIHACNYTRLINNMIILRFIRLQQLFG